MSLIRTLDDLYDHFGLTGPEDDRSVIGLNRRINALAACGARISIHGMLPILALPEEDQVQAMAAHYPHWWAPVRYDLKYPGPIRSQVLLQHFRIQSGRESSPEQIESEPLCFNRATSADIDAWMLEMEERAAHARA